MTYTTVWLGYHDSESNVKLKLAYASDSSWILQDPSDSFFLSDTGTGVKETSWYCHKTTNLNMTAVPHNQTPLTI